MTPEPAETVAPETDGSGSSLVDGDTPETESGEAPSESPEETDTEKEVVTDSPAPSPEQPEIASTAAGTGIAAQLVELVGGTLLGTDAALLSSPMAQEAFDCGNIGSWWNDSSSTISDAGFSALLEAAPDVCFEISGITSFTESQVAQLEANGIQYVTLPSITSVEKLKQAASIIGETMGHTSEASEYCSWVDSTLSSAGGSTMYTFYVAGWDDSAQYTFESVGGFSGGSGLPYAPSKYNTNYQLLTDLMSSSDIVNTAASVSSAQRPMYYYVTPLFCNFASVSISGSIGYYMTNSNAGYGAAYDPFTSYKLSNAYYQLGMRSFPAVIVPDEATGAQLAASPFWQYYAGNAEGYIETGSVKLYRAVLGDYDILTAPFGLLGRLENSVDAPLEALWLSCELRGELSIEQVKSAVQDFYREFYDAEPSDSLLSYMFGE